MIHFTDQMNYQESNNNQSFMELGAQNPRPDDSSSSIMSRFESPASAFYATERYMGFQPCPYSKSYTISSQESSGFSKPDENKLHFQTHFPDDYYYYSPAINQFSIQDRRVGGNPFSQLGFSSAKETESQRSVNPVAAKTRIRWTQNLHERFVDCVNRLGGAEKATPKAILKLMGSEGLTIFHVKSHLQKYRIAKYMPDSSQGRFENRSSINDVDTRTRLQINEALQLQLDVQRRLHDQLEVHTLNIQKNLQLRIEEQGRQLKRMFDEQQIRTNGSFYKNQQTPTPTPTTNESSFNLEDFEVSDIAQGSNNTHFPSKIS
ncbi:myb family transcription factor PHL5 isoform X2 [Euphorbia lathyris]|uniref:myb family transcription factor PHL5 isoform X2 n=1 Tax=Euphorbia lathyris TaxID=212925 RepID=UPI00331381D6